MNDEGLFWIALWRIVAIAICAVSLVIGSCTAYESSLVETMVQHGADPIIARCGINPGNTSTICSIAVARGAK